jgi:succinoglycan biosynthesis transport protein ExoP
MNNGRIELLNATTHDGYPALPGPSPEPGPSENSGLGLDPMRILRNHYILGLAVFAVFLTAGVGFAIWKGKPTYRAEATIYVSPNVTRNPQDTRERDLGHYQTFIQQQIQNILRRDVLAVAIERLAANGHDWRLPGDSMQKTVERLQSLLVVAPVQHTYQIQIALESNVTDGLAETVNTVAQVYLDSVSSDGEVGATEKIEALRHEREQINRELAEKIAQQVQLSEVLGVTSADESASVISDRAIAEARTRMTEARARRIEAESRLNSGALPLLATDGRGMAIAAESPSPKELEVRSALSTLRQRLGELKARDLGAQHPMRKATEEEIARLELELTRSEQASTGRTRERLQADLRQAQMVEKQMEEDLRRLESHIPDLSKNIHAAATLRAEVNQLRGRGIAVAGRIADLEVEARSPRSVRMFSEAVTPSWPVKGGRKKLALLSGFLSIFLAAAAMVLAEHIGQKIRNAHDLESILGFSPVGQLLEDTSVDREFAHEQFLRFVAGIERARRDVNARTILLTSLRLQEDTSFLMGELGRELRSRGLDVVTVNANALERKGPEWNERGLTEFLVEGSIDPAAIVKGSGGEPDRVPVGNTLGKPRLPQISRLPTILSDLEKKYSIVLVEGPPLLLCADAEQLVGLCDATILVVEAQQATRADVQQAVKRFKYVRPTKLGAVLTRVMLRDADAALKRAARDYSDAQKRGAIERAA